MNSQEVFCPNVECSARGQPGQGNISVHSQKEHRYYCTVCGYPFAATKGTIFYRLRTRPATVMLVLTLLAYGGPLQAIVKAFGFDERTGRNWLHRAGQHCQAVHHHQVEQAHLDLQQVQADEIKAKHQGGISGWLWP